MIPKTRKELAAYIDHTLLKATARQPAIRKLCDEAVEYGFYSVCVNPRWVPFAAEVLQQTPAKVCCVVSFPLGADSTKSKAAQAKEMIRRGADEVDMVADLASIVEGDREYLANDLRSVLKVCRSMSTGITLKVIIESAALSDEQIIFACQVAQEVRVDFIKTSTGMSPAGGASIKDVKLMAQTAPRCKIKASGGIRTTRQALDMIAAGASRIGASASMEIVEGLDQSMQPEKQP